MSNNLETMSFAKRISTRFNSGLTVRDFYLIGLIVVLVVAIGGLTAWNVTLSVISLIVAVAALAALILLKLNDIWLLALFVFLIPFSVRVPSASFPVTVTSLLLISIVIRTIIVRQRLRIYKSKLTVFILLMLTLAIITSIFGINPANSYRRLYHLTTFVLLYFIIQHLVTNEYRITLVFKAMVAAGTLMAVVGIMQFAGGLLIGNNTVGELQKFLVPLFDGPRVAATMDSWREGYYTNWINPGFGLFRALGTFFSPMAYVQLLFITYFPILMLALRSGKIKNRSLLIALVFLYSVAIFVSLSRGAWLIMSISLLIIVIISLRRRVRYSPRVIFFLLGISLIALIIMLVILPPVFKESMIGAFDSVINPTETSATEFRKSNESRFETYQQGLIAISENPLLGVGPGNYSEYIGAVDFTHTHSIFLNIAAEMGLFTLAAFILILIFSCWNFYQVIGSTNSGFIRMISAGWLISIISLVIYWFFTAYIYEPKIGMAFWLVVAMSQVLRTYNKAKLLQTSDL